MHYSDRFVLCSDSHGDMQDDAAVADFFEFVDFWKPGIRVHMGDAFDFRWLRRGANDAEKSEDVNADVETGCALFEQLRPTVWIKGNHDDRLQRGMVEGSGATRAYCTMVANSIHDRMRKYETRVIPYGARHFLQLGDYKVIHGINGGVNATRQHAATYGNVFHGHTHHIESTPFPHLGGARGVAVGCLCRLEMDYNKAHATSLRQAHGWVYGKVLPSGGLVWWQAQKVDGVWHLPSEMVTIGGKA